MKLPHLTDNDPSLSFKVAEPEMELRQPQVDTAFLSRLGTESPIPLAEAAAKLAADSLGGKDHSRGYHPAALERSGGLGRFCVVNHGRMDRA